MINSAVRLFSDYVTQPIYNAVNDYLVQPAISFATRKATEVGTKEASKMGTKMASRLVVAEKASTEQQADFNSKVVQMVQTLPKNGRNWAESKVQEETLGFALKTVDAFVPSPTLKVAKRVAPKALFQYNRHKEKDALPLAKLVATAATSHAVGTLAQEAMDSTLPQAAPYGGYVAYGVSSMVTELGCEYLYKKASDALDSACDKASDYILGDVSRLSL